MKISIKKLALATVLLILGASSALGFTVTTSSGGGGNEAGTSTAFSVPLDSALKSQSIISFDGSVGLSNTIIGSGDLTDRRWVSNTAGSYAEEGVTIANSESYVYTYALSPGEGAGWSSSMYPTVSASGLLDVNNAGYINAYSSSRNARGFRASASIELSDPAGKASLLGYSNNAAANKDWVSAEQATNGAIGATGLEGVGSVSTTVKDKSGREAKSIADFIGDYSIQQSASMDRSTLQSSQSLMGSGYFEGAATYAKDGKGKEASSLQVGAFSGIMGNNHLEAGIDASSSFAAQESEFEYQPVSNGMGAWNKCIFVDFSTSAKDGKGKDTVAMLKASHGEHSQNIIQSKLTASGASSDLNYNMIGVGAASVFATDNTGKKAESKTSYVGVFSDEQLASIDKFTAQSLMSIKGVGFFAGATTSAKDGKGKEAIADELGGVSGNTINNLLGASAGTSTTATLESEFEYMPIGYRTFIYDSCIQMSFGTLAKDGKGIEAAAQQDVSHGEHFRNLLQSALTTGGASSALSSDIIGFSADRVYAMDKSGKKAESKTSYVGVYSNDQSASIDKSTAQSTMDLKGVGYFEGATTSAKDGKGKEAIADELGAFSGNLITNLQGASAGPSTFATLQSEFEYMPVSYQTGIYNSRIQVIFNTAAKDGKGGETAAKQEESHGEKSQNLLKSALTTSCASSSLDSNLIGMATDSVSALDKCGRKAESTTSYVGDYTDQQLASTDTTAAQSSQSLKGVGFFEGAETSATDGKGKEATTIEDGSFSGTMIKNVLSASVTPSLIKADQDISAEYMPVSYITGTYDQKVAGIFSTSARDKDGRESEARVDVAHTEHYANIEGASIDKSTAKASNFAISIIGVAAPGVSVKDKSGREANSLASFTGVYYLDQKASMDRSTIQSSLDMNGAGYFAGATTFAGNGKDKSATAYQEGAISGYMGLNKQNAFVSSGARASQTAMFDYHPVSYQTGIYDISWMTFGCIAQSNGVTNPVVEYKWDVSTPYQVTQEVGAPTVEWLPCV